MSEPLPKTPAPVAVICNSLPPYRVHLHRRIVAELPEIELWSLCTHEDEGGRWAFDPPAEIRPVRFGVGESPTRAPAPSAAPHEWRKAGRIIKFLKEKRVAAVILSGYNDAGRLRLFLWCKRRGVPVMIFGDSNIRGDLASGVKRLVKRALVVPLVTRADALLACGSLGLRYFERYGADPSRVFVAPYEPDYALIERVTPAEAEAAAASFGLRPGRRRVIFSGRLVSTKRPDLLLNAFARLLDERPEWDLVMAGDGPLRAELAASLPPAAAGRVVWTGFLDDQARLSALYRACDVLVLPSDHEPWALVVNEAAGAGLALVCSDRVGASADLVEEGVNGLTFPAGDGEALLDALRTVTDPSRIEAFKSASAGVLARYRRESDPVAGWRRALASVGAIAR